MKVIAATPPPQPAEDGDYFAAVEGELVMFPILQCDGTECGCDRGFVGLASGAATSTATVANLPGMTRTRLRDALFDSLHRRGWIDQLSAAQADQIVDEQLSLIRRISRTYPSGTVIRRHDHLVWNAGATAA